MIRPAVIESMTPMKLGAYRIRIWQEEHELRNGYDNKELVGDIAEWYEGRLSTDNRPLRQEIAMYILQKTRVNAVEVVDFDGEGIVLYREWP